MNRRLRERLPNEEMLRIAEQLVKVRVTPAFNFSFEVMNPGVLQHIDRRYTYDLVPPELLNGLLFQGIHRTPEGTTFEFELLSPATIYIFFHHLADGGYKKTLRTLKNWKRSSVFPQYDIHNGKHGLKMIMHQLEADVGTHSIPTTTRVGCLNFVFQRARGAKAVSC